MKKGIMKRLLVTMLSFLTCTIFLFTCISFNTYAFEQRYYNFSTDYTLTDDAGENMLNIALAQAGKTGGELGYNEPWCADFVSDCAVLAGQSDAIPGHSWVATLEQNIRDAGGQPVSSPKSGDIVFFGDEHVEIVCTRNGSLQCIGGNNSGNKCAGLRSISTVASYFGTSVTYIRPAYNGKPLPPPEPDEPYAPYPRPTGLVKKGMKGLYVKWVQYRLQALGYDIGSYGVDGDFGDATYNAVIQFQTDRGLEVDGIVGEQTRNALITDPPPIIGDEPIAPYPRPTENVYIGMKGDAVKWVQHCLFVQLGYNDGGYGVDGDFGEATKGAVIAFQNDYGLEADGIVGEQTRNKIVEIISKPHGEWMEKGAGQTIPDGDYVIYSQLKSDYYLDIEGTDVPAKNNTNVYMTNAAAGKLPPECDVWTVKYAHDGFYTIMQKGTDMALDLLNGDTARGTNVQAHIKNDSDAQLWSIKVENDGYCKVQARCSSYCLDIDGSKTADCTNVLVWESTDNVNQRWKFKAYGAAVTTTAPVTTTKATTTETTTTEATTVETTTTEPTVTTEPVTTTEPVSEKFDKGIDVSEFQGAIDWQAVAAEGNTFAVIRSATTRVGSAEFLTDSNFEQNYADAKAAGLKIGSYLYTSANSNEEMRSNINDLLGIIAGKQFDLPVYLDIEQASRQSELGKDALTDVISYGCSLLRAAGYQPGVYANKNWYSNYIDADRLRSEGVEIWMAAWPYSDRAADPADYDYSAECKIWQYSSSGSVSGISGRVDVDVRYGKFEPVFTLGDVNDDSSIDLKDVMLMRRALAGWDVTVNEAAADVNKDGSFDLKDVVILRRYLAGGWDIEL